MYRLAQFSIAEIFSAMIICTVFLYLNLVPSYAAPEPKPYSSQVMLAHLKRGWPAIYQFEFDQKPFRGFENEQQLESRRSEFITRTPPKIKNVKGACLNLLVLFGLIGVCHLATVYGPLSSQHKTEL